MPSSVNIEEWEDVEDDEMDDDDDDDEEEEAMDDDPAALPDGHPPALPGSLPLTDCLFCCHHSRSLMKNIAHMTKVHSFFIPDVEFLVDLRGLIRYLGEFLPGEKTPSAELSGRVLTRTRCYLPVFQERRWGLERCVCGATRGGAPSTPPRPSRVT